MEIYDKSATTVTIYCNLHCTCCGRDLCIL